MQRPEISEALRDPPAAKPGTKPVSGNGASGAHPRGLSVAQRTAKRTMDLVGATLLLLLLSPLYVILMLAVQLSMGRPVHFWQHRIGKGGRPFRFYKFRSMVRDGDRVLEDFLSQNDMARTQWNTFQKLEADPRVTVLGGVLRKTSLDELPQLWNVIKGDMSLVGPRPCMSRQRSLYGNAWPSYCAMRPGITGLWQISGRNRLPYARRVELDVEYVANWSLWCDVKILLRTVRTVALRDGSN
ncbi:Exopolysaccharide production protein ExoY [Burkholderiales bacterium 8X]|nr:Exopolysaccharide production protein ExoY [Burkholderiales bacterium 8X]